MVRCPFCHFDNEDGALFCEQCKSDLAGVPATPAQGKPGKGPPPVPPAPLMPAVPVAEAAPLSAIPTAEAIVAEAVVEPLGSAYPYEAIPVAPVEPLPPMAVAEALPLALEPEPPAPAPPPPPPVPRAEAAPPPPQLEIPPAPPPPVPEPVAAIPQPAPAPAPAPAPVPAAAALPPGSQPRLLVLRGQKRNVEYPVYEGLNFIGRADEKPVDIDLEEQEPPDRIWCSRQHACISFETDQLAIEDLNSANGTYVNRTRVYPGTKRPLNLNDLIQIGNVQLKVIA